MKTATLGRAGLDAPVGRPESLIDRAQALMLEIGTRWRQAREDRKLRAELGTLGDGVLRDIGLGDDEIQRLRANDDLAPRSWTQVAHLG
jgi:uncharacterized protein YjiS (DUF1127 family)